MPHQEPADTVPSGAACGGGGTSRLVTLFLAGDVMTGRAIDQVLPHPGDPRLYEPAIESASEYVALAERVNGPIPRPVAFSYVWGDALEELDRRRPDARIVNLETAVTREDVPAPKGINYRMSPANVPVLTAAAIDCCVLANNHVLDWGAAGLRETLRALDQAGLARAGAGLDLAEAAAPARLRLPGGGRLLVFGIGLASSGIPRSWAASADAPGVHLLPGMSPRAVNAFADGVRAARQDGDVVLASLHWGPNFGYHLSHEEIDFAHALVDEAGVDVVHGHSSHHPKAVEIYRGRPILYGCGDFLNDYEGIGGYESFRGDLVLSYFPVLDRSTGRLARFDVVPFQIRNFRLNRADDRDAAWLRERFNEMGQGFGTRLRPQAGGGFSLEWE